ncbi:zinc knuckle CX2CX4HX4C containing protein [Tanacetum coccineum]
MVNFGRLENSLNCENSDITIPIATVEEIAGRFENTLYGYFIGNDIAFPVVEYYVHNPWAKYAFNVDGLSFTATKLGEPKMLDMFTSVMCVNYCGRNSFARALIKLDATCEFKDELVVALPRLNGSGYTRETIRVEYEWKPLRCYPCIIFGHVIDQCPRNIIPVTSTVDNDGFQESKFRYEPKGVGNTSKSGNGSSPSTSKDGNKHNTVAGNGSGPNTSKDGKASGIHFVSGNTSKPTNGSYRLVMKSKSSIPVSNPFSTLEEDNCNYMDDLVN